MMNQYANILNELQIIIILMSNNKPISSNKVHPLSSLTNKKNEPQHKLICTHLIDGIYQGFVNSSYQRDGFGILQTDEYQTYIGFHRYNKIHGLGIVIYSDGSLIYGNFVNGLLSGIALTDSGNQIQIGTFKQSGMIGIGFQFNIINLTWRMNRYHKGVSIEIIKQQKIMNEHQIPTILSLEEEILSTLLNYRNRNFFQKDLFCKEEQQTFTLLENLNNFFFHEISETEWYFGSMIDDLYEGLGLLYHPKLKKVLEVGMYRYGKLDGYGILIDKNNNSQLIGHFYEGKREGIFYYKAAGKIKFHQYYKDTLVDEDKRGENLQKFKKTQKIYFYRQKDFLSSRHNLNIYSMKVLFESSEYRAWKLQQQAQNKIKLDSKTEGRGQKAKPKSSNKEMATMGHVQSFQKSSIQIMKQKIYNLSIQKNDVKSKKNDKGVNIAFIHNEQKQQLMKFEKQQQDDQIALEQNPITKKAVEFFKPKKSVGFNQYNQRN